jgi:hypothetical protein
MKNISVMLLIAVIVLAGCSSPQLAATQATGAKNTPTGKPAETAQEVHIVLKKSGGYAGVDESWTISSDGRITTSAGKTGQVSGVELSDAVHELEKLGFFEMKESYVPMDTCCDRFTYQLEVTVNGGSHSVTVLEATPETPAEFWQALDAVNGLLLSVE